MAEYTSRKSGKTFKEWEKKILEDLWINGELCGVGKKYTRIINSTGTLLGRSAAEIKVSELACIANYYEVAIILHSFNG
jgi:hypothetical protein